MVSHGTRIIHRAENKLHKAQALAEEIEGLLSEDPIAVFDKLHDLELLSRMMSGPDAATFLKKRSVQFVRRMVFVRASRYHAHVASPVDSSEAVGPVETLCSVPVTSHQPDAATVCSHSGSLFSIALSKSQAQGAPAICLSHLLAPTNCRIFSLIHNDYGWRGGYLYHKPSGWVRWTIPLASSTSHADWPVCYHGTRLDKVLNIASKG